MEVFVACMIPLFSGYCDMKIGGGEHDDCSPGDPHADLWAHVHQKPSYIPMNDGDSDIIYTWLMPRCQSVIQAIHFLCVFSIFGRWDMILMIRNDWPNRAQAALLQQ